MVCAGSVQDLSMHDCFVLTSNLLVNKFHPHVEMFRFVLTVQMVFHFLKTMVPLYSMTSWLEL